MKKNLFKSLSLAVVAIAATLGMSSCRQDPKTSGLIQGLEISAVTPSFNSVTFSVNADPAVAVAYICVPQGEPMTAKEVFEKGTASGTVKGVFTAKSLTPSTKYTLYVAKRDKSLEGPSWYNFETTPNSILPPDSKSVGMRVEAVDKSNIKFEVMNGEEVDYSYIGVWPDVYMENFLFEAEKAGKTREEYIRELVLGYPYLCAVAVGRGKTTMFDYLNDFNSEAQTSKLWPAADYMIISLGMQGDPDKDGKDGTPGGVNIMKFRTEGFEMLGKPAIVIDTMYTDYIRVRYKFKPGSDAACYALYATKKAEIDEFVNHYDKERGAGQGVAMLKEFIRFSDPYVADHTDVYEYSLTYGFEQEGIDFEMIAVPMDKNLMPGEMARRVDQVRPTPGVQVDAKFDWVLDPENKGIGATNYWYKVKFYENCGNIFWRLTTKSEYEAKLKELGEKGYSRDLWLQGWGEGRTPNPGKDKIYENTQFRWGVDPNKNGIIVAVGLNYTGGLTAPRIVAEFKTKQVVLDGGAEQPQVDVEVTSVGKTTATLRYWVPEGIDKNTPRVIRNIVLEKGDPALELSDAEMKSLLYSGRDMGKITIIGNEWSVYSIDVANISNPYDWEWAWTNMTPGTDYVHVWLTEDLDGLLSGIKRVPFQTARNDGGPNPRIDIAIDPLTIKTNPDNSRMWGCTAKFTTNSDAVTYDKLFVDRPALEHAGQSVGTKAELEAGLKVMLVAQGMKNYIDPTTTEGYYNPRGSEFWVTAMAFGAGRVEGALTYRMVKEDGTVGELIESKLPQSFAVKYQQTAPFRGLAELKARDMRARENIVGVEVAPPFAVGEPQAYDHMTPAVGEIKPRSMKDITMEVLTRGNYKK